MKHSTKFLDLVQDAKSRIQQTDVGTVRTRMQAGEAVFLIDVREESEWEAGHIPGSVHLGKGILERDIEQLAPDPEVELVLYCGGGFRSALAADMLRRMGYRRAVSMDGGIRDWRDAGYPLEID
jgi:rhodanese-related sulfurtransferase